MTPHTLTASEVVTGIRGGRLSAAAVVEACLARIERHDPAIRAWVHVDREGALAAARELDGEARAGRLRGPLHGVPVGIKDIYHVAGMVTTAGASAFAHERPPQDAEAVARLRRAGAIILGKTATTEFAYADPTVTRNPWNLAHTPGGSSSGSAAAVAARMIPLALGSQTIGSTLRPAAYCGIVGLKPTHGRISAAGVIPLAWSLDHVGIFARSVEDAALVLSVLAGYDPADLYSVDAPTADYLGGLGRLTNAPRLGVPRGWYVERASQEIVAHLDDVAARLAGAGATVEDVPLPPSAHAVHEAGQLVLRAEAAAVHETRFMQHTADYQPKIRGLVESGLGVRATEYIRARQVCRRFRVEMTPIFDRVDALLMPVAPTAAPRGLASTGDPTLCAPWSFAGLPAIALPSGVSPDGLPLAIQLAGGAFREEHLLCVARWCESVLGFAAAPPEPSLPDSVES
ncbi:MAG: amidase [Armatimonadota bacterium]|nr:amidase [Armatimonadota bacterium]MDR7549684.1 amidase [Armatimonadota bacterium]